ncbi:MAG TPA: hypothetical protein VHX15_05490 [Frankiaceae bacterium]|jgi:hypothetical protein|nr:hypothetical protein [Frankiaceae bacterium]
MTGIGKTYNMPPQPADEAATTYLDAGAVSIGVEYRVVDPESLRETYQDNPQQLAELEERSPQGGFFAEGLSLHVVAKADGHEYLRFDLFDDPPHYHYNHPVASGVHTNNVVDYDTASNGPMLDWTLDRLRTRLPEMLRQAGGDAIAGQVDAEVLVPVLTEVARLASAATRPAEAR